MFDIVGFGSRFESLFGRSVTYNEETLKAASAHVQHVQPNLGGTEILQPLEAIFARELNQNHARRIVVLTDGEVSNPQRVLATVKNNASSASVFTLGVGPSVSHSLVEGMA